MSNRAAFKLIEPGLCHSYKRGRRAMSRAYDKPEETAFHEWRKRVIGRRVYAEKPGDFVRRMCAYREAWQAEIPAPEDAENDTLMPH